MKQPLEALARTFMGAILVLDIASMILAIMVLYGDDYYGFAFTGIIMTVITSGISMIFLVPCFVLTFNRVTKEPTFYIVISIEASGFVFRCISAAFYIVGCRWMLSHPIGIVLFVLCVCVYFVLYAIIVITYAIIDKTRLLKNGKVFIDGFRDERVVYDNI